MIVPQSSIPRKGGYDLEAGNDKHGDDGKIIRSFEKSIVQVCTLLVRSELEEGKRSIEIFQYPSCVKLQGCGTALLQTVESV